MSWTDKFSTKQIHLVGALITTVLSVTTWWICKQPDLIWTTIIPVVDALPADRQMTSTQIRGWLQAEERMPERHRHIAQLKSQLASLQSDVDQWLPATSPDSLRNQLTRIEDLFVGLELPPPDFDVKSVPQAVGSSETMIVTTSVEFTFAANLTQACQLFAGLHEKCPARLHRLHLQRIAPNENQTVSDRYHFEILIGLPSLNKVTQPSDSPSTAGDQVLKVTA